jgi:hypothetical protein
MRFDTLRWAELCKRDCASMASSDVGFEILAMEYLCSRYILLSGINCSFIYLSMDQNLTMSIRRSARIDARG